jgi:hypothetical protein
LFRVSIASWWASVFSSLMARLLDISWLAEATLLFLALRTSTSMVQWINRPALAALPGVLRDQSCTVLVLVLVLILILILIHIEALVELE